MKQISVFSFGLFIYEVRSKVKNSHAPPPNLSHSILAWLSLPGRP